MPQNLYALILSGGSGERFWPLSRHSRPKQMLSLFSETTLLESTVARLSGFIPPEKTLVLTHCDQEAAVRALLPTIPRENIIVEPAKRDTAAAIALGAGVISRHDRSAVVAVLPADQVIRDVAGFQRTISAAAAAAHATNHIVTVGIRPGWACPSFGYIELGERARLAGFPDGAPEIFEVAGFREKPNTDLAESFLRNDNYRWNAGMFLWTVQGMLGALDRHIPELAQFIAQLHKADDWQSVVADRYASLPKVSLDYAVMEKAAGVLAVEAAFDWDDVGSWTAAAKYWDRDEHGNAAHADLTAVEAFNNIVYAEPGVRITLLGVQNLVVVQTADAVLVCHRRDVEKIKMLVGRVPASLR